MKECPNTYYIVVIENTDTRKVVAAASLVLEQKFIHEIAMVRNLYFKKDVEFLQVDIHSYCNRIYRK